MKAQFVHIKTAVLTCLQMLKCVLAYRSKTIRYPTVYGIDERLEIIETSNDHCAREILPKIIWIYWHEPDLPVLIRQTIAHNKSVLPGYEFRVLDKNTVLRYLPEQTFQKDTLLAHRADLIRLELLLKYGGIWIDGSVILGKDLSWVEEAASIGKYDIISYYSQRNTADTDFPVIETWFIAAPAQNGFIQRWRDEFSQIKSLGSKGYHQNLTRRPDYDVVKQNITRPAYLMLNLAEQIVSRAGGGMNAYLKKCEDSAFYVQEALGWDNYAINFAFTQTPVAPDFTIVKLTSGDRMLADSIRRFGLLKKKSLLGQIVYRQQQGDHI